MFVIDLKHSDRKGNFPSSMFADYEMITTSSESFLDKLCDYFANIGASTSKNIPKTTNSCFKIYGKSCLQSFFLDTVDEEEVSSCISSIKTNSAPEPDEILPKFVKAANVIILLRF